MKYIAVFEKMDTGYSAYIPDLPGCIATGATREEVQRLIREAIAMHIEALREAGEPVPEPTTWAEPVEA